MGYIEKVKFTSEDQIKIGDEVIIVGTLVNYKGTSPELKDCHIVKLNGVDEGGETGGDEGGNTGGDEGGSTGGEGEVTEYTTNIDYTLDAYAYKETATVNGEENVKVVKIGKKDEIGQITLIVPAGTKSISYYAVGWSGKTTTLQILLGETEIRTQNLVANTGAFNSSPYTLTVAGTDKYSLDFGEGLTADTEITVTTTAKVRALLFGIQAVK